MYFCCCLMSFLYCFIILLLWDGWGRSGEGLGLQGVEGEDGCEAGRWVQETGCGVPPLNCNCQYHPYFSFFSPSLTSFLLMFNFSLSTRLHLLLLLSLSVRHICFSPSTKISSSVFFSFSSSFTSSRPGPLFYSVLFYFTWKTRFWTSSTWAVRIPQLIIVKWSDALRRRTCSCWHVCVCVCVCVWSFVSKLKSN